MPGPALCSALSQFETSEKQLDVPSEDSAHDLGPSVSVTGLYSWRESSE